MMVAQTVAISRETEKKEMERRRRRRDLGRGENREKRGTGMDRIGWMAYQTTGTGREEKDEASQQGDGEDGRGFSSSEDSNTLREDVIYCRIACVA